MCLTELLNMTKPAGLPSHELRLMVGVPVIILRNVEPPLLCNGTRCVVNHLHRNFITVEILNGVGKGQQVNITRINTTATNSFVRFTRRQFPLKVAYAMTINKSQSQTLDVVGVDSTTPCFAHGQLYVACSRAGHPDRLFILAKQ